MERRNQRHEWLCGAVLLLVVGSARRAHAAFDGPELEQMLSWACVIPIGLLQFLVAFAVRKHVAQSSAAWTVLATAMSLVAGLLATLVLLKERALVPVLSIALLGPGVPNLVCLVRARTLPVAMILFILPPLPFIYWVWEKVW